MITENDFLFLDQNGFWDAINNKFFLELWAPINAWKEKWPNIQNPVLESLLYASSCYFLKNSTLSSRNPEFFKSFSTEDSLMLFQSREKIKHVGLRSLLLDALWQYRKLGKNNYSAAIEAFEGYKESIKEMEKEISTNDPTHDYEYERLLEHMCGLALSIDYPEGKKYIFEKGESLSSLPFSEENKHFIIIGFNLLLRIHLSNEKIKIIIQKILELVDNNVGEYLLKNEYYQIALSFAKQIKDNKLKLDIRTRIAENFLNEADQCTDGFQKAHAIQQAIEAYRKIPGSENKWKPLMHQFEEASANGLATFKFASFSVPLDPKGTIQQQAEQIKTKLANTSLDNKLLFLASQLSLPSEENIIESLPAPGLEEMITSQIYNSKGQVIRIFSGETNRERAAFYRVLDIYWTQLYLAILFPIFQSVQEEHYITPQDFIPYCRYNPFVPEGHEALYALGFSNWFSGKHVEAISILVPLLENSLRETISRLNPDIPVFKLRNGTCEDIIDMQGLLDACKKQNVHKDIIFNLEILLLEKSNNIRNNIAHGKYNYDDFQSIKVQILLWIIFWFVMYPWVLAKQANK